MSPRTSPTVPDQPGAVGEPDVHVVDSGGTARSSVEASREPRPCRIRQRQSPSGPGGNVPRCRSAKRAVGHVETGQPARAAPGRRPPTARARRARPAARRRVSSSLAGAQHPSRCRRNARAGCCNEPHQVLEFDRRRPATGQRAAAPRGGPRRSPARRGPPARRRRRVERERPAARCGPARSCAGRTAAAGGGSTTSRTRERRRHDSRRSSASSSSPSGTRAAARRRCAGRRRCR